jgi:DNA-binding MarR family transcriptional regulator
MLIAKEINPKRVTHFMDYDIISFIARARRRRRVLACLYDEVKSPKQIAKESKTSVSNVYRSLKELQQKGLIVCKTPDSYSFKYYSATMKGKEIIDFLKSEKN